MLTFVCLLVETDHIHAQNQSLDKMRLLTLPLGYSGDR